jgi:hypothetical protein
MTLLQTATGFPQPIDAGRLLSRLRLIGFVRRQRG